MLDQADVPEIRQAWIAEHIVQIAKTTGWSHHPSIPREEHRKELTADHAHNIIPHRLSPRQVNMIKAGKMVLFSVLSKEEQEFLNKKGKDIRNGAPDNTKEEDTKLPGASETRPNLVGYTDPRKIIVDDLCTLPAREL